MPYYRHIGVLFVGNSMKLEVVSHTIGRIRYRTDFPFGFAAAEVLADKLDLIAGIEGVQINPRTRSILLLYVTPDALSKAKKVLRDSMRELSKGDLTIPEGQSILSDITFWPTVRYLVTPYFPMPIRILSLIASSWNIYIKGIKKLLSGKLTVEVLDVSALTTAILMKDLRTASMLTLLLGFGDRLEEWTRRKTMDNLARSLAMNVDTVWVVNKDGEEIETPISVLTKEDVIVARAGTAIPVDGVIVKGEASVNQASMTGEPIGVLRTVGNSVFAGTVIEDGEIHIRPTNIGSETRLNKIINYIENSEKVKAKAESEAINLANRVVPYSFLLASVVWGLTRNLARVAGVLMVDYSCALKIATPVAFLSAMKEGANRKMLIKGGKYIEELASVDTVVFDKTGTLTKSCPKVAEVVPLADWSAKKVLRVAACLEEHFPHPVAKSVVKDALERKLRHEEEHAEVKYIVGHGICSMLDGEKILIGSRHYLEEDEGLDCSSAQKQIDEIAAKGHTVLYLSRGGKLVGLIGVEDPLREESADVIERLKEMGIKNIVMITGDGPRTAANVAKRLGITEYYDQVLPDGKAGIVKKMVDAGRRVLMIGDGINDSPALTAANVGVTVCDGADLAREVAAVVLLESNLAHLPEVIRLGRKTMERIHQNFHLSIGLNSLFLAGGLFGVLPAALGAILHNSTTVGVTVNAVRPMLDANEFEDDEEIVDQLAETDK